MSLIKLLIRPYPLVCVRRTACVRPEILSSAWGAQKIPHQPPPKNNFHPHNTNTTEITILTYEEGLQKWREGVEEAIKNSAELK